ncbi:MAG: amidase [Calditrichaceae bacterium]|nr:amidase [Calditrichaceae bacterium]MBN2708746.1 amidase [Calditrichaceae bacterium]RQV97113.1 MAG: amidase [Calditrichota bacterium]
MRNKSLITVALIIAFLSGYCINSWYEGFFLSSEIEPEQIKAAEKLIGLEMTPAEKDSMINGLKELRGNYQNIRAVELENGIMPAILFNPIPDGFQINYKQEAIKYGDYSSTVLPDNPDDLAFYSIGQLAHLIKTKKITSVNLTRLFLDRLKKFGPRLECVITLTEKRAMEKAKQADDELAKGKYRGLLHGIPYGAKDLLAVKGYKTTWGAMPFKDQFIDQDATVIKKLDEAGAVLCAKLSLGALAWGDVWFGGKTRNPWNIKEGSSGSSAGSAAAVSAGLLPFALGTETWGSIVSPSTVCGVTGLRPTYGSVSRYGAMALSWSMDKIGPICRNAEDAAMVYEAIKGEDGLDKPMYNAAFNYNAKTDLSGLKIGYLESDFKKDYPFHINDSLTIAAIRTMGFNIEPVEISKLPVNDVAFILNAEAAAAFDELTRSDKDDLLVRQIQNAWPNVFRMSRFIPAVEYINANRIRTKLIREMKILMDTIDIYIAPSWEGDNLLLTNLTGHPCVVIPNGFSEDGTPTSISFIGRLFGEAELIAFSHKYQQETDHHLKHPVLE